MPTWFKIIGDIADIQVIAKKRAIREMSRLQKLYGKGNWRKLKGYAIIELGNSQKWRAEIHWYECHGIGKKEIKVKNILKRVL